MGQDVTYRMCKGLLDLQLEPYQVFDIVEYFRNAIKMLVRRDEPDSEAFVEVHRMSRMCWELQTSARITNMDKADAALLYGVPQNEKFEWVFKILNKTMGSLRDTNCSIVVADHVAKSIDEIMCS